MILNINEIFPTNKPIFVEDHIGLLKTGMKVRIATNDELKAANKSRRTGGWSLEHEQILCYKDPVRSQSTGNIEHSTEYRTFNVSSEVEKTCKSNFSIPLYVLNDGQTSIINHEHWTIAVRDLVFITKNKEKERTLNLLIKIKDSNITPILLSADKNKIAMLKETKEKTAEENTKFKILEIKTLSITTEL